MADTKLQYFSDTFSDFDRDYQARLKGFNKWNAQWRGRHDDGGAKQKTDGIMPSEHGETNASKSKLFVNQSKVAVVNAVSSVMSILFQQLPPFTVSGRSSQLDDDMALMIQKAVWYFMQQSRFQVQARRYCTDAAIYGSAWAKVYMGEMRDAKIVFQPQTDAIGVMQGYARQEQVNAIPMVKWATVSPYDMWVDPEADWVGNFGRGAFHRVRKSANEIKQMILQNKWRQVKPELLNDNTYKTQGSIDTQDYRRSIEGLPNLQRKDMVLYDFWGTMPTKEATDLGIIAASDEILVPAHVVLLGDSTGPALDYLVAERNPLPTQNLPFIHDVWEDLGHSPHGRGVCENAAGPQMALNVSVNTAIDNRSSAIQQIMGVNIDQMEDPEEDLVYKQNWIMRFNGNPKDALFPLTVPNMTDGINMEIEQYSKMIEEQSGIAKLAPDSFGSNRTAGGMSLVFQSASKFLRDITFQFEQNLIGQTARLMYQHILLFMPDEFLVNLTDNPLVPLMRKVALKDLAADCDFIPMGLQGLQMKETELQQLIQFAQSVQNPITAPIINWPLLVKNIYKRFGFKDADQIILSNNLPPEQQRILQELMQALGTAPGEQSSPPQGQPGQPGSAGPPAPAASVGQQSGLGGPGGPVQ